MYKYNIIVYYSMISTTMFHYYTLINIYIYIYIYIIMLYYIILCYVILPPEVGYRGYAAAPPLFPFGHGLSYAGFLG